MVNKNKHSYGSHIHQGNGNLNKGFINGSNNTFTEQVFEKYINGNNYDFGQIKIPKWVINFVDYLFIGLILGLIAIGLSVYILSFFIKDCYLRSLLGRFFAAVLVVIYHQGVPKNKKELIPLFIVSFVVFILSIPLLDLVTKKLNHKNEILVDNVIDYALTYGIACSFFPFLKKLGQVMFSKT